MAGTLANTHSYSSALPQFALAAKNTLSNVHLPQNTDPIPSLHPNSFESHYFSQSQRHPSLPPRPPAIVSTSTADRVDGLPQYLHEVDNPFNDLIPTTREMKPKDLSVESPVYVIKDYSDDNHTRESLSPSMALSTAYADLPPPSSAQGQSQFPRPSGARNQVDSRRGSHHLPVPGQATSLGFGPIGDQSTLIPDFTPDDFDPQLSKNRSSGSSISNKSSPNNNPMTLSVGDGIAGSGVDNRPLKLSRSELGGHNLEQSDHRLAKSPSVMPEPENPPSNTGESVPESESDVDNFQDQGHQWEFRRILGRRFNLKGDREALLEWEPTWVVEEEISGLKSALRRYAKERREGQSQAEKACPNCGVKKRKYHR